MRYAINEQIYFDFKIQLAKDLRSWLVAETETEWAKWFRTAQGKPYGKHFRRKMKRFGFFDWPCVVTAITRRASEQTEYQLEWNNEGKPENDLICEYIAQGKTISVADQRFYNFYRICVMKKGEK